MNIENFEPNIRLFRLINGFHTELVDRFIDYFHYLGQVYSIILILVILWFIKRGLFYRLLVASLLTGIIVTILKVTIAAPRPAAFLNDVILLRPLYRYSFPSGDAAVASVITIFFFNKVKLLFKILLILYCILIFYGRIYFGVHFPLDIIGGFIVALVSTLLSNKMFVQIENKKLSINSSKIIYI